MCPTLRLQNGSPSKRRLRVSKCVRVPVANVQKGDRVAECWGRKVLRVINDPQQVYATIVTSRSCRHTFRKDTIVTVEREEQ